MRTNPVIICGDFIEDPLSPGRKAILELFQSKEYTQLITSATTDKHMLLDHIYISHPDVCLQSGVLQAYHSYHNPVYCFCKNKFLWLKGSVVCCGVIPYGTGGTEHALTVPVRLEQH